MDASEVHFCLKPHYFYTILLGDATVQLRASKHCIQVDDKKDEDVVAVLLDEPAPEGQLKTQEIVFLNIITFLLGLVLISSQQHTQLVFSSVSVSWNDHQFCCSSWIGLCSALENCFPFFVRINQKITTQHVSETLCGTQKFVNSDFA